MNGACSMPMRPPLPPPTVTTFAVTAFALTAGVAGCHKPVVIDPPAATRSSPLEASPTERIVGPLSTDEAEALATMTVRLNAYRSLRKGIADQIQPLNLDSTPQQINLYQRTLEARIRAERSDARQGDIFTAEAQPIIKRLLAVVFSQPDGKQIVSSISDVSITGVSLVINGRYPDAAAVSTMPPQVLQTLPRLGEGLQYRFVNRNLILYDSHARIILDFIPSVLPV